MASDGITVNTPVTRLVQGSRAQTSHTVQTSSGTHLPPSGGKAAPSVEAAQPAKSPVKDPRLTVLVAQLNKHLNDSGRPDEFRLNTAGGHEVIQRVDPDSGQVVSEYPKSEFPVLAQGLGAAGLLLDSLA